MLDISPSFGGTSDNWLRLAEILGTTSSRLELDGMLMPVHDFVTRQATDPSDCREARRFDDMLVCPVAYALAKRAGWDPVAPLVLEEVGCDVTISHSQWFGAFANDWTDGHVDVDGPVAPGIRWSDGGSSKRSVLRVSLRGLALPETVLARTLLHLPGQRLSEFVKHPDIPPSVIVDDIETVEDASGATFSWIVWLDRVPERIMLHEAVNQHV